MEALEFLTFSGRVVSFGKAGARSALSRAYYAVFHLAHDLLADVASAPPRNGKSHNLIPIYLKCSTHFDVVGAANLLSDLHSVRIKADYQLRDESVEGVQVARLAVERADRVRLLLDSFRAACAAEPVRQELVDGISKLKGRLGLP